MSKANVSIMTTDNRNKKKHFTIYDNQGMHNASKLSRAESIFNIRLLDSDLFTHHLFLSVLSRQTFLSLLCTIHKVCSTVVRGGCGCHGKRQSQACWWTMESHGPREHGGYLYWCCHGIEHWVLIELLPLPTRLENTLCD